MEIAHIRLEEPAAWMLLTRDTEESRVEIESVHDKPVICGRRRACSPVPQPTSKTELQDGCS